MSTSTNGSSESPRCAATSSTDIELFIEFSVAAPSMILYALIIFVYFKSPQLRSSYYLLFFVHSCINIVYFTSRALIMRVSSFSFLCQWVLDLFGAPAYTFTPLYFIYHYTQHAQALSIIAININRVIAIYFYNNLKLMQLTTYVVLVSILLIPLPLTWHLTVSPVKFITSLNMIGMDYTRVITYPGLSVLHLAMACTATGVVALTTIMILIQMKSLQKRRKNNERSLIIVSLLLSFGLLLSATVQYIIYTIDRNSSTYFLVLNYRWIVTDFMSLFPPWSLLCLSSAVRTEVYRVVTLQGVTHRRGSIINANMVAKPRKPCRSVTLPFRLGAKDRSKEECDTVTTPPLISRDRGSTLPPSSNRYVLIQDKNDA